MQYRKGIYVIVKRGDKYLLALNRKAKGDDWYFPGGGLEGKETLLEGFYREAKEELLLLKKDFQKITITPVTNKHDWSQQLQDQFGFLGQEKVLIIGEIEHTKEITLPNDGELAAVKWVTKEESIKEIKYSELRDCVIKVLY
jgi:8-oxo-dGTP pyrophosphatase MutT (NUDIX family)